MHNDTYASVTRTWTHVCIPGQRTCPRRQSGLAGSNDPVELIRWSMTVIKTNAITVPEGSGDELARRFATRAGAVDGQDGFQGFELLRCLPIPVAAGTVRA